MSLLEFPPLELGEVLRPPDDDLLAEMLPAATSVMRTRLLLFWLLGIICSECLVCLNLPTSRALPLISPSVRYCLRVRLLRLPEHPGRLRCKMVRRFLSLFPITSRQAPVEQERCLPFRNCCFRVPPALWPGALWYRLQLLLRPIAPITTPVLMVRFMGCGSWFRVLSETG